ncbi:EF-hand calcium-binding domain-containing protein 9 isoform X1 [Ahaetulla prasina]|uniref:EF-hand calcium-binding domain-containing protein 9 isoform X1 n=1 Tax=Ahaetulla prasina TaxID=499056 RepID=UPI002647FF45|nr:EF-hand calcium-binding domain-containing protein 9 isoform X1 [Ahaetulla prasina]
MARSSSSSSSRKRWRGAVGDFAISSAPPHLVKFGGTKPSSDESSDMQFYYFVRHVTNLSKSQIMLVFDLLDWDGKGEIGFDEFYMLVCIIMAHENHLEKQFMYRHSHAVFELLDIDGGHTVAPAEFQATRFLFNVRKTELSQIFKDFDISGDEQLNYKEFRMFTIFCIDRQQRKAKDKLKREMAKAAAEIEAEEEYADFTRFKQKKF